MRNEYSINEKLTCKFVCVVHFVFCKTLSKSTKIFISKHVQTFCYNVLINNFQIVQLFMRLIKILYKKSLFIQSIDIPLSSKKPIRKVAIL